VASKVTDLRINRKIQPCPHLSFLPQKLITVHVERVSVVVEV